MLKNRYKSFDSGKGKSFEDGKLVLEDLYKLAKGNGNLKLTSWYCKLLCNNNF